MLPLPDPVSPVVWCHCRSHRWHQQYKHTHSVFFIHIEHCVEVIRRKSLHEHCWFSLPFITYSWQTIWQTADDSIYMYMYLHNALHTDIFASNTFSILNIFSSMKLFKHHCINFSWWIFYPLQGRWKQHTQICIGLWQYAPIPEHHYIVSCESSTKPRNRNKIHRSLE